MRAQKLLQVCVAFLFALTITRACGQVPRQITQEQAQSHLDKYVAVPPDADARNLTGVVKVHVVVGKNGKVSAIKTISGHPMLIPRVIQAVRQWTYRPFVYDGKAAVVAFDLDVRVAAH
jgi:outer membrane biosynthesis protein TonB